MVGLNRAERLPRSTALAFNYVVHANDMAALGWHRRAEKYYQMAIALSEELNDQWGAAMGLNHFALGCLGAGRYEEALAKAAPGRAAFTKLGDFFELHVSILFAGTGHYFLGNVSEALEHAMLAFDSCVRHEDNYCAATALYALSRSSRGQLPVDELMSRVKILPGNNLAASTGLMAEGYWHAYHRRTAEAVSAFEQAWKICWTNTYGVYAQSSLLCELATALRLHADALDSRGSNDGKRIRKRARKMAAWANGLSWFLPSERPHALRELSLAYAHRGRIKKAWMLAAQSCRQAKALKAKYEYAKSLLVLGKLAQRLGRPEAEDQIREASAAIQQIENATDARLKRSDIAALLSVSAANNSARSSERSKTASPASAGA
jgi:hypothetical protein